MRVQPRSGSRVALATPQAAVASSAATFDADRQRHVRALAERLPGALETLTMPLAQLHARRDARLRALLRVAKERSLWHAAPRPRGPPRGLWR